MDKKKKRRSSRQARQGYIGADVLPSQVDPPPADWLARARKTAGADCKSTDKDAPRSSGGSQKR